MGNRAKYDVHNTNVVAVVLPEDVAKVLKKN